MERKVKESSIESSCPLLSVRTLDLQGSKSINERAGEMKWRNEEEAPRLKQTVKAAAVSEFRCPD